MKAYGSIHYSKDTLDPEKRFKTWAELSQGRALKKRARRRVRLQIVHYLGKRK